MPFKVAETIHVVISLQRIRFLTACLNYTLVKGNFDEIRRSEDGISMEKFLGLAC